MNVNKITVKSVVGNVKNLMEENENETLKLMNIAFRAIGTIEKETMYGLSVGLTGEFIAINVMTGEEFVSTSAWLPGVASAPIIAALEDNDVVEGVVELMVVKSNKSIGYEYACNFKGGLRENPLKKMLEDLTD